MQHRRILFTTCLIFFTFVIGDRAHAADSQILSVTPPLFQLSAVRGDIWQSSIKVINGNPYPLTVYAEVVNFKATGEDGQGTFIPIINEDETAHTLAQWITITQGPHVIPSEQTEEISFFVEIPKDAPPGGHYAAVLISTEPPQNAEKLAVKTSQVVSSLFFLRIEGDVQELGTIREFRATKSFLERPEAEFSLRFENKGNVHLQPRGNIIITNMWGTERGVIPVNYQTHFGNVLPNSIRDFKFAWKSTFAITDVGRYKVEATLAYGEDGVKTATAIAYFWIIPVKATLITLGILTLFISLIVLMIKAYVRRMLKLAGVPLYKEIPTLDSDEDSKVKILLSKQRQVYRKASAPLRSGVLDLRERLDKSEEFFDIFKSIYSFILTYKFFFLSMLVLIGIFISIASYIGKATEENQDYTVIIKQGDGTTTLEGKDIVPGKD